MPSKFIAVMLDKLAPHAARNWFKVIRALCQFGVANRMSKVDPTAGMKPPRVRKSEGHHTITAAEVAQYETAHPIGTEARLALALGLYTMQRNSDVIRMGPQHVSSDGWITVRQKKTGTPLEIPVHPDLQVVLDATPTKHLTFLVSRTGKPYSPNDFCRQFRVWCNEAGLPTRCKFHGLRKAGATRFADAGCSALEIAAWGGWKRLSEVQRYTKAANQKRLAQSGLARFMNANASATSACQTDVAGLSNPLTLQEEK